MQVFLDVALSTNLIQCVLALNIQLVDINSTLRVDVIQRVLAHRVELVDVNVALSKDLVGIPLALLINKLASHFSFSTNQFDLIRCLQRLHPHLELVLQFSH